MRFIFFSPVHFEKWDWRNSVEKGIGGSETSHVEMAWRLAKRGHEVISYSPIPEDCPGEWRGTTWKKLEETDFSLEGVWILYRCPQIIPKFLPRNRKQKLWLMMQDWDYPWTPETLRELDKILVLSEAHKSWLVQHSPVVESKVWVTSNAMKNDLLAEVEAEGLPQRNPKKIMYASSPDRGLDVLLRIFKRVREIVPDAELHTYYGFNNIDKMLEGQSLSNSFAVLKQKVVNAAAETPGVVMHGRVSQKELYREWLSAGVWCYPSEFWETSCITCMEAQAMGAVPVINPVWAQGENTKFGLAIQGQPYGDPLTQARFAAELAMLVCSPERQERIRVPMMADARKRWDWENFVGQWEDWALETTGKQLEGCRVCGSTALQLVADLGEQALATVFPSNGDSVPKAPLRLVKCQCGLHQLDFTVHRDRLFKHEYGYRSSMNETMKYHLIQLREEARKAALPSEEDLVVDIGSNDGYLWQGYAGNYLGFEPSEVGRGVHGTIHDYFQAKYLPKKAKLITSVAMFYDLEDPVGFCRSVAEGLTEDGVWVNELQYLPEIVRLNAFDTICHEHVTFWTLGDLDRIYQMGGLTIKEVSFNRSNGGSVRITAMKGLSPLPAVVTDLITKEAKEIRFDLRGVRRELRDLIVASGRVMGYGASTKGNVLLQTCDLGPKELLAIADKNPAKWGKTTPNGIPIISEEEMREAKPDKLLMLPWAFASEFIEREPWADWIVPLPKPYIVKGNRNG